MCGGVVSLILTHLPHIIAPLLGLAFLARFALYVRRLATGAPYLTFFGPATEPS